MRCDLMLRGVTIVRPEGRETVDVALRHGKIDAIGSRLPDADGPERDCTGRLLLPGLIDPHVHLRTPGNTHKEDFHTGTLAAVSGGITCVLDMPNTTPPTTTRDLLREKRALASGMSVADFGLYLGATSDNVAELQAAEAEENFAAIKVFMGASTGSLLVTDPEALARLFEHTRTLICVHAEDEAILQDIAAGYALHHLTVKHSQMRPPAAAVRAVSVALELALEHQHPLHICHASTQAELNLLAYAPRELVSVEASPHHLLLNDGLEDTLGNFAKVNPPLRAESDRLALLQALQQGRIDVIGTDHAPHLKTEKAQPYAKAPSGIPHLDTSLISLLHAVQQGHLTLEQLVRMACQTPARRFGIAHKGRLEEGFDADLVLLSEQDARPLTEEDLYTRCGWSPFTGWELPRKPAAVWIRGIQVAEEGRVIRPDFRGQEVRFQRN